MTRLSRSEDNMVALPIPQPEVPKPPSDAEVRAIVLACLNESETMWRTTEGIADETGLPVGPVKSVIDSVSDILIRAALPDSKGHVRFTTLRNYRAHAGILRRVLSALSDQVR